MQLPMTNFLDNTTITNCTCNYSQDYLLSHQQISPTTQHDQFYYIWWLITTRFTQISYHLPWCLGGGAAQPKCGVACSKRIWCGMGGSKMDKLCGILWTPNGGEICKIVCDVGRKIKMTQHVCRMGCFLTKKAHVRQQYLQKVLELCGMWLNQ